MSGTVEGGMKARDKMLANNPEHYKTIGREGGLKSRGGGVTGDPKRAKQIGSIGGKRSKPFHKWLYDKGGYSYYIYTKTGETRKFKIEDKK